MQPTHVSKLLNMESFRKEQEANQDKRALDDMTIRVVNILFRELQDIFPAFKQAWPSEEDFQRAKRSWVKAFMISGINQVEQLRFGLRKCRLLQTPFIPTSGQFIAWCNPDAEDYGLPNVDKAYAMSIRMNAQFSDYVPKDKNANTVITHTLSQIGRFEYRTMSCDKSREIFEYYYLISCKQFANGELRHIHKSIAEKPENHPSDKGRSDEARKKSMEAIRNMLR